MKLIKDLLYTKGNNALDVARSSIFGSVICYWVGVFTVHGFNPLEVGGGAAALFGGAAGWLHFRQKQEGASEPDPS